MPIQIKAPDGSTVQFPDGTDDATITSVMQREFGGPKAQASGQRLAPPMQQQPRSAPKTTGLLEGISGAMANFNRGTGVLDEVSAALSPDVLLALGRTVVAPQRSKGALANAYQKSLADVRGIEDNFAEARPFLASQARGTGMAATLAVPGGQAIQGTRAMNMARGAVTAGATAAAMGVADRGTAQERLQAGGKAAVNPVTLALGAGVGALTRTAPRAAQAPATPAARLTEQGVPTTIGQRTGGLARRLEDVAESLPMTGAAIKARKTEAIEGFNNAAINEALAPIGASVRGHGRTAIQEANERLSNAYDDAVEGVRVYPDADYLNDIQAVVTDPRLPAATRAAVNDIVGEHTGLLNVTPNGRVWKNVDSEIGKAARAADNASATVPGAASQAAALQRLREAHGALLERQAPEAAEALARADASFAAMERVRNAAAKTGTAAREGLFTAGELNSAVAATGGRSGRRAYGQGTALMQELSDDGQAVLPSTVPDSGTALRSILTKLGTTGGALAGLGTVAGSGPAVGALAGGAGLDAAGALLYSRTMQDALRRLALSRQSGAPAGLLSPRVSAELARAGGLLSTPQAAPRN